MLITVAQTFLHLQFRQDGHDLEKIMKWTEQYSFAFPLWFGPSLSILNIHHPAYVKTILTTTGADLFDCLNDTFQIHIIH